VYARFSEGFDTADLRAARELLQPLAEKRKRRRGQEFTPVNAVFEEHCDETWRKE
jgi:hypothetical protein